MENQRQHILTIALEDYFQVGAFRGVIRTGQWYRYETRLEKNLNRTFDLLDRHQATATFFVLGWVAERYPELVREIVRRGHEVASKGYLHQPISEMSKKEFFEDALRSKELIEEASLQPVLGYRLADGWIQPKDLWALEALQEAGYCYDSSIAPIGRTFANRPQMRFLHTIASGDQPFWEVPISTSRQLGLSIPIGGGNYWRQLPQRWLNNRLNGWVRKYQDPLVFYFHTWELDPDQPKLSIGSRWTQLRHYRHLDRMESIIDQFLNRFPVKSVQSYLQLQPAIETERYELRQFARKQKERIELSQNDSDIAANPEVTIVIPCYNEEPSLPYLANTLKSVRCELGKFFQLRFLLVDDCSTDATWSLMERLFAEEVGFTIHRHAVNKGVAGAIQTGIQLATTEIVCSMDADCTYDPHTFKEMIPKLTDGVDLVTASPYHTEGQVLNVPRWRLTLSHGASWLYRQILHHQLATYTSCFRVYRRSNFANQPLERTGYLGVAEMLVHCDQNGGKIIEHPATLEVRTLGQSKMKTFRTIMGHLKLMRDILRQNRQKKNRKPLKTKTSNQALPLQDNALMMQPS